MNFAFQVNESCFNNIYKTRQRYVLRKLLSHKHTHICINVNLSWQASFTGKTSQGFKMTALAAFDVDEQEQTKEKWKEKL